MLTDKAIEAAKLALKGKLLEPNFEHNDCIRIAYEWLDAQHKIKARCARSYPIKHLIENWAGRYVSRSDVEVAAYLHPAITGKYPRFNISSRLTEPSVSRLKHIAESNKHEYRKNHDPRSYQRIET